MKQRVFLIVAIIFAICLLLSCSSETSTNYWPTSGWKTISPKKVGMDEKVLEQLNSVQDELGKIGSIIAVRHGYIAYEKYYIGSAATIASGFSITKSVISSLIGIAIKQGKIESIEQRMVDFFPNNQLLSADPIAQTITLRHLLTMSDGIRASGNMIEYYFSDPNISRKVIGEPGSKFKYNDLSAQIASLILTKSTGKSAIDYAKENILEPLGIRDISWKKLVVNGTETSNGAYGILLTPRDFAKIGYLFLKKGTWENRELIPAKWIADSTAVQIETKESSDYLKQYGYYWWTHTFGDHPGYFALGWSGQVLCVVPELDLVGVVISKEASLEGVESRYIAIIEKYIIASITK